MILSFIDPDYIKLCEMIGEDFHNQIHEIITEDNPHLDDPEHNFMVGQALLIGLSEGNPYLGCNLYNHWAMRSGYRALTIMTVAPDAVFLDIVMALIRIDKNYRVSLA